MIWPIRIPREQLTDTDVSLRQYTFTDADGLYEAIRDERVWEHIPKQIPCDSAELDSTMRASSEPVQRIVFTVRQAGRIVGTPSIFSDPSAAASVEIGATQLDPAVWGTGTNDRVKQLLIRAVFEGGAQYIRFRTDERNTRSAAAIRKLGATGLGVRQDTLVRRDGTVRRSRFFRLDRPAGHSHP